MTISNIQMSIEQAILDKNNKEIKNILKYIENEFTGKIYLSHTYFSIILWCLNNKSFLSFRASFNLIKIIYGDFYKLTKKQKICILKSIDNNIDVIYLNKGFISEILFLEDVYKKYNINIADKYFLKWKSM